jgi:hypothetical protein
VASFEKTQLLKMQEHFTDLSEIIENSIDIAEPNLPIIIHEGNFKLKNSTSEVLVIGTIKFTWFPRLGSIFNCEVIDFDLKDVKKINLLNKCDVIVGENKLGEAFINQTHFNPGCLLKGTFIFKAINGDKTIPVEKVVFSVPNLREFLGHSIKKTRTNGITSLRGRIILETEKYIVNLDKSYQYDERIAKLEEKGGYHLLYSGEIQSKKGAIIYSEISDFIHSLNVFLSFLNGRRTSLFFINGIFGNEVIWSDFSSFHADIYEYYPSWPEPNSIENINELWQNFDRLWKNIDNRNFINSAIHWYIEANKSSGFGEGAIILAQTALELLYNWFVVEQKKIIIGKDSENINAANKIRLLLSQINVDYSVPKKFTSLQKFIDDNNNASDAPEAIVQIRNSIVHSQEEKRKKLSEISDRTIYESLQLSIWYIELSILAVLKFQGRYVNRSSQNMSISGKVENVPWK